MKLPWKILLNTGLLVAMLLGRSCLAGVGTSQIDLRQANQQRRIEQGVASGALTNREAVALEKQQMLIRRQEAVAKADGVITKAERTRLTHRQNEASRAITRKKHNLRSR